MTIADPVRAVCVHCGKINRIPADRSAVQAKCGGCGEPLFDGKPADVSATMLERQIAKGELPVVVDVWAPWCGPCRVMGPAFEAASKIGEPGLRFLKLNSDENQEISSRLNIRGIPTMLLFADGREVARVSGAMSTTQITSWIASHQQ